MRDFLRKEAPTMRIPADLLRGVAMGAGGLLLASTLGCGEAVPPTPTPPQPPAPTVQPTEPTQTPPRPEVPAVKNEPAPETPPKQVTPPRDPCPGCGRG